MNEQRLFEMTSQTNLKGHDEKALHLSNSEYPSIGLLKEK
ncbi:hypothetical protein BvCmsHHP056_03351 [Escherichia coli]|nr:hypothetical protein BvCmsHHP056_03351 [Escherichia coli]